ncbi:hypothetical protein J7E71_18815 [Mesobacillus foraminis]|uniref:DUF3847 domain-containing protein n=1 Tax=Mesobacillus foraminis TaxID=279826 RepID=UPI001BEC2F65|nr:DUF3847 domain-containing protein [Mesobacillus foraminis]MBT2757929.1 hypothetical protein [Mesobacillus foraminis]
MMVEDIQRIEDRIKVLEQKKRALEHKISSEDRKDRTRRLIQKGALLEKYLGLEDASVEDTEKWLKVLADFKKKNAEYVKREFDLLE